MVHRFLNSMKFYEISDLQEWGHCGLCGNSIDDVFPKDWSWGICDECKRKFMIQRKSIYKKEG